MRESHFHRNTQPDQEVVITLIDAMIIRQRVTGALMPIDQHPKQPQKSSAPTPSKPPSSPRSKAKLTKR